MGVSTCGPRTPAGCTVMDFMVTMNGERSAMLLGCILSAELVAVSMDAPDTITMAMIIPITHFMK